jgi:hypothetical protein
MHCRKRFCANAGPEEMFGLVSLSLCSSERPGFDHTPRIA